MSRGHATFVATEGPATAPKPPRRQEKVRAEEIVAHVDAAIARKSGRDITDLTDEELLADLRRHRKRD